MVTKIPPPPPHLIPPPGAPVQTVVIVVQRQLVSRTPHCEAAASDAVGNSADTGALVRMSQIPCVKFSSLLHY